MTATPLPYISRPEDEDRLHAFLLERLERRAGAPKAFVICGRPGVGKRTLIRQVYAGDPRFRAFRIVDPVTRELLTSADEGGRGMVETGAELLGHGLSYANPLAGLLYGVAHTLGKDRVLREPQPSAAPPADYTVLEQIGEPVLFVVPRLDPADVGALRRYGALAREAFHRGVPLALLFLDDAVHLLPAQADADPSAAREEYLGLAGLGRFLEDARNLEVLALRPFSPEQCGDALVRLGLSAEWANVLYQFSEGGASELASLWAALQGRGLVRLQGGGRWTAVQPAAAGSAWELIRDRLIQLVRPRTPADTVHEARLVTACLLAASMGPAFLPQAVAESTLAADPRREEVDGEEWEDLWYEVLERDEPQHPALAGPRAADGPEVLRGDDRQFFVYAFRDPALANLLRAAVRQMWRERAAASEEDGPHLPLARGTGALEDWLDHAFFAETRPEVLLFRAALLRVRNQNANASSLEDLAYRLRLRARLEEAVARERPQVQAGADLRALIDALLWYAETLGVLGDYPAEADALAEVWGFVASGRVVLLPRQQYVLLARLGAAQLGSGRFPEAEAALTQSLGMAVELFGREHANTLVSLTQLGSLLRRTGRLDKAEPIFLQALDGLERTLGRDHPSTVGCLNNLASVLRALGRPQEAEPLYRRALESRQRALGPDHPTTLTTLDNLALVLVDMQRYEEAEPLVQEALDGYERVLGPDHPDTLTCAGNYAMLLCGQTRLEEAELLLRHLLQGNARVLGPDHPSTLTTLDNLASVLVRQGRHEEAEPLFHSALQGYQRVLGPLHPDTITSAFNFGSLLRRLGRMSEAVQLVCWGVEGLAQVLGPDHPTAVAAAGRLLNLLGDLDGTPSAEPLRRTIHETLARVQGVTPTPALATQPTS